jgi:aldehyde dehydrogenase (NAD+)
VLILSPWNYPFNLLINPLVAAVAAGNCAILRPSEKVPHTARVLERLVADAFPPEEVAVVGGGVATAEALLELPFDHVFFTGSTAVGRKVMAAAAKHLGTVTLELGGKSPAVVDETADVRAAARRIAWGKFVNAGQTCVAPDYVMVHAGRERELVAELQTAIAEFYGATEDERQRSPDFARIVDAGAFRRLDALLRESVAAGARVEAGGRTDEAGRYVAPTLLTGVRADSPAMREEIFGPILPILTFRSIEEVVAHVRRGPKPLAMYVFSRRRAVVEALIGGTSAGGTVVNNVLIHLANPSLPFGGVGESGQGSYHGRFGFRAFSHERSVLVQGRAAMVDVFFPPYRGRLKALALRVLRRLE